MSTTTSSHRLPPKPLDLELTIISAKHLKNVNWRNGDLNPYVIFWLDPERRLATKSDDSNSTKPVWNERFIIPFPTTPSAAVLTLEIFHSKPLDMPKPLVGTLRLPVDDLPELHNPNNPTLTRNFDLRRPSGRINGKIRLKLAFRERPLPDYRNTPQPSYYYNTAPPTSYPRYPPSPYNPSPAPAPAAPPAPSPPPPPLPQHPYNYGSYSDPYPGYYQSGYYSQPPPPPPPQPQQIPPPYTDRPVSYGAGSGGPSAPVDFAQFDQKQKAGKLGLGSGVEGVAGGLGGLSIHEGLRYEDEKIGERAESELNARELDDYNDYRRCVDY